MSVSVNQILSDARRLVSRLRDHDSSTETIIHKAQILYKNVQDMKEYNEEVSEQNVANELRNSRSSSSGGQENHHIKELRLENRELRLLLEEHQSALELLMSKYRQRATALVCDTCAPPPTSPHSTQELQFAANAVCGAAEVMRRAMQLDDVSSAAEQERLTQLRTENRGLRELLSISSLHPPLLLPPTHDKTVQTEEAAAK